VGDSPRQTAPSSLSPNTRRRRGNAAIFAAGHFFRYSPRHFQKITRIGVQAVLFPMKGSIGRRTFHFCNERLVAKPVGDTSS
jgi:hypothetical protein